MAGEVFPPELFQAHGANDDSRRARDNFLPMDFRCPGAGQKEKGRGNTQALHPRGRDYLVARAKSASSFAFTSFGGRRGKASIVLPSNSGS